MALYDYSRALKAGKKRYQASLSKGEHPYLPVLDDILSYTDIVSEVDIGLVDIPLSRIVGTKTQGRTPTRERRRRSWRRSARAARSSSPPRPG